MPKRFGRKPKPQIDLQSGILVLDDSTLEKPYSERNALVYRHWSGKQKAVVSGINLITLLWTDGERVVPVDYRVFDKDRDGKTKNDHFADMLIAAFERGFDPNFVCFDSWYGSIENLKLVRSLGWHFLTRLKANRQIRVGANKLQAVSDAGLTEGFGTLVRLKGFGEIKVFRVRARRRRIGILGSQFAVADRNRARNSSQKCVAHRDVSSCIETTMSD